jgi:glyoxylase-like metal-dependent hydrolase (beta-lactamase superfamily II)
VVGKRRTIWLDAGSSAAHTQEFAAFLADQGVGRPSHVVLTHSHWDHVFGASELDAHVVAHELTSGYLEQLATLEWSDEALDGRVAAGQVSQAHADNVKAELPAPREVRIASADIVFTRGLRFELDGVSVQVCHVGGDHADDSTVMYVVPDRVLFLGDCLYEAPSGGYTAELAVPLIDTVRGFGAELFVDGHNETVLAGAELDEAIEEAGASLA